ncbi:hypothetical protein EDD22DRAFT_948365 [Suillus occidentalis]|nr:hypothetical protein EDD22DRAFT_948365 [Suillus occidentalis]
MTGTDVSSSDDEVGPAVAQLIGHVDPSQPIPTSSRARAKHRIAALEEELEVMRQERGGKQRKTTFYVAQGRAIHQLIVLYHSLEDMIMENDRRYEFNSSVDTTAEQDRLQCGYIEIACLKKGVDAARGDDTSTLKELVAAWVNKEFRPSPLIKPNDKYACGFASDICGKLLCPAKWDWSQTSVQTGIHDRTSEYIVSENSWPLFVYENYQINSNDLEAGFLKSRLLVMVSASINVVLIPFLLIALRAFKAIFTSPSSASQAEGDGDGADILENNRHARCRLNQMKVKTCVASIINMRKVTPRAIAYIVRFALSSVSSWCMVDGDFDYEIFWCNIVDFFENVPGPVTRHKIDKLLEWWTRNFFGTNHCEDLTKEVVSQMSVNTLAKQRKQLKDATFDSN